MLSTVDLPAQPWHRAQFRDTGRGCSGDGCWPSGPTDPKRRESADVEEGNKQTKNGLKDSLPGIDIGLKRKPFGGCMTFPYRHICLGPASLVLANE